MSLRLVLVLVVIAGLVVCCTTEKQRAERAKLLRKRTNAVPAKTTVSDDPGSGAFLRLSDFERPASPREVSREELITALNAETSFYLRAPQGSEPDDACDDATDALIRFDPFGDLLTISAAGAPEACIKGEVKKTAIRLYSRVKCPNKSFDELDGKTGAEIEYAETRCDAPEQAAFVQSEVAVTFAHGVTVLRTATMSSAGRACVTKNADDAPESVLDDCLFLDMSSTDGLESRSRLSARALGIAAPDDPFYASGSMDFEIDGWRGTMQYRGGKLAPTWEAVSATGETALGTFGE